jgi:hypothetical protein
MSEETVEICALVLVVFLILSSESIVELIMGAM